jgi:hypothetical protein
MTYDDQAYIRTEYKNTSFRHDKQNIDVMVYCQAGSGTCSTHGNHHVSALAGRLAAGRYSDKYWN